MISFLTHLAMLIRQPTLSPDCSALQKSLITQHTHAHTSLLNMFGD